MTGLEMLVDEHSSGSISARERPILSWFKTGHGSFAENILAVPWQKQEFRVLTDVSTSEECEGKVSIRFTEGVTLERPGTLSR